MGADKWAWKCEAIGCKLLLFMGLTERAPPKSQTIMPLSSHVVVSHGLLPAPGAASIWHQHGRKHSHIDARGVAFWFPNGWLGELIENRTAPKEVLPKLPTYWGKHWKTRLRHQPRPLTERNFFFKALATFCGTRSVLETCWPNYDVEVSDPRVAGDLCLCFVLLFAMYFHHV